MEFRLLGPLEVAEGDKTAHLASARQRAVLAMLVLAAPEVVSTDRLLAGLWGEQPPKNPAGALQVHIHGVRKALRDLAGDGWVERLSPGYRLVATADQTDVGQFAALQRRARDERLRDDPAAAARTLAEALGLWRGPALSDVGDAPFAEPEAARLEELRMLAREDSYDVRLALGEHADLVADLERAVADHPMRERLWGQLMTALYRCHRQGDALATYAHARERLADELGVDPDQALQQLELAILRQDPALAAPQVPLPEPRAAGDTARVALDATTRPAVAPREPARLPRPSTPTFGRDELIVEVCEVLADSSVRCLTLTGPGGTGKSRAAVVAASAVADQAQDRVVYIPVTERTDVSQLAREVTLAVTGSDDPAALADLAGHTLVVLDNLEATADGDQLVEDLVQRTSQLTLLATSRLPLRLRAEHCIAVPPLEVPAEDADAPDVAASPAVQMFVDRATAVAHEFRLGDHLADVADLVRYLDGLPLAIELAAAHALVLTPGQIRAALDEDLGLLTAHTRDVPERQRTLTATIEWSYAQLDPDTRAVADRLSLFERGFTVEAVEAVCEDVPDVLASLTRLVEARLIRSVAARVEVRFVLLGTVRAFAHNRLVEHADLERGRLALTRHLLSRVRDWAADLDGPEGAAVVGRYDDTAADVDAALDWAAEAGRADLAVELATSATDLWVASGRLVGGLQRAQKLRELDGLTSAQRAGLHLAAGKLAYHLTDWDLAAAELRAALEVPDLDPAAATSARTHLGAALVVSGGSEEGAALASQALAEAEQLGSYPTTAIALSVLAIDRAIAGDAEGERGFYERRLAVVSERGDVARLADTLNTLAEIALDDADAETARAYAEESVVIAGPALLLEARDAAITLARAAAVDGDVTAAADQLRAAWKLADRTGQSLAQAQCLRVGGCLAVLREVPGVAVRAFAAAQAVSASPSGTDEPIEADLAGRLAQARAALGGAEFGREWQLGRTLPLATVRAKVEELLAAAGAPGS